MQLSARFLVVINLLFVGLVFGACAKVGAPTGGTKDVTPPKVLESIPANETVNFSTKEIVFSFNEYVKLNNISQQFFSSPSLAEMPEFKIRKQSIIVVLKSPLKPNTTYSFSFGDAIVDVNENNPLKNFTYVFSTGDFLDSLKLGGKIIDSYTGLPQKDFTVMLYDTTRFDSLPFTKKPDFLGRTNEQGEFTLANIRKSSYQLIAVKDVNKDLLYQVNEEIAFTFDSVSPDTAVTTLVLKSFKQAATDLVVVSKKLENRQKLLVGISKPCATCDIKGIGEASEIIFSSWKDANADTLFALFRPFPEADSLQFVLTNDTIQLDTLTIYPGKVKNEKPEVLKVTSLTNGLADAPTPFRFSFKEPIANIETADSILILGPDSVVFSARLKVDSLVPYEYYLDFTPDFGKGYTVYWPDSNFVGLYGNFSSADTTIIATHELEYYGTLQFNVENLIGNNCLLQIKDTKGKFMQWQVLLPGANQVKYLLLSPSVYQLTVIVDENKNGVWDAGNYLLQQQAERVINYKATVEVRSNWDKELDWKLDLEDLK